MNIDGKHKYYRMQVAKSVVYKEHSTIRMVNSVNGNNITLIYQIKRSQEKDHIIILIDAENDHLS